MAATIKLGDATEVDKTLKEYQAVFVRELAKGIDAYKGVDPQTKKQIYVIVRLEKKDPDFFRVQTSATCAC